MDKFLDTCEPKEYRQPKNDSEQWNWRSNGLQRQAPGRLIAELYQTSEEELRPSLTIPQNWKGRNASKLTTRSYCHSDGKTGWWHHTKRKLQFPWWTQMQKSSVKHQQTKLSNRIKVIKPQKQGGFTLGMFR